MRRCVCVGVCTCACVGVCADIPVYKHVCRCACVGACRCACVCRYACVCACVHGQLLIQPMSCLPDVSRQKGR